MESKPNANWRNNRLKQCLTFWNEAAKQVVRSGGFQVVGEEESKFIIVIAQEFHKNSRKSAFLTVLCAMGWDEPLF
jgi:hypothetical protein